MNQLDRILLVDDDEMSHFLSQHVLRKYSHNLTIGITYNGQEAVEYLLSCDDRAPSIILLDIDMPVMNGFEFLEWFHRSSLQEKSRIVVLTSSFREEDKAIVTKFPKVIGYLEKPLTLGKLETLTTAFE